MCQRKCEECKNQIDLEKNSNEIIYFDGKYYHKKCFLDTCQRKMVRSNANPKWRIALDQINNLVTSSREYINNIVAQDEIFQFIIDFYGVKIVPRKIFQRLADIYSGQFQGMSVGIPAEDLLDMWKRKQNELNKIHYQNKSKNRVQDEFSMITYDLSVLVNKYDSYLRWKDRQKILEQDGIEIHSKIIQQVDLQVMGSKKNVNKETSDDMDSLLDEIFD